jgi:hypothetical protein
MDVTLDTSMVPSEQLIRRIRTQAQMDVVFDNVCRLFANRQRSRQDITIQTLQLTTKAAGYNYSRDQHVGVLLFLSSIGVGELERKNAKVVALRNIKYNLQSIGAVANLNKPAPTTVETFKPSYGGKFLEKLENRQTPPPVEMKDQSRHAPLVQTSHPVTVTFDAGNGLPFTLTLPHGVDLAGLIAQIMMTASK